MMLLKPGTREPAELWNAGDYSSYCGPRYRIYIKPIEIHMKCFDTEKKFFLLFHKDWFMFLGQKYELQKLKTN